jgi:hypothetical protein
LNKSLKGVGEKTNLTVKPKSENNRVILFLALPISSYFIFFLIHAGEPRIIILKRINE